MVCVVSYKMFAMVIPCKKKDARETIVDQRDVDIGISCRCCCSNGVCVGRVINKDLKC